jgi:hypothetical protein
MTRSLIMRTSRSFTRCSSQGCARRRRLRFAFGASIRERGRSRWSARSSRGRVGAKDAARAAGSTADAGQCAGAHALIELRAQPDDYLFKNVWGGPIEAANSYDLFRDAQRALSISPLQGLLLRDGHVFRDSFAGCFSGSS